MSRTLPFAAVLGGLATFAALDVATAQQSLAPVQVRASAAERNSARIATLESQATVYSGKPRDWRSAAHAYRRAAALRGADSLAVTTWRMAAWAYIASQDLEDGRMMMERAAECAATYGDVERAANAYVDAALIAGAEGREDRVHVLVNNARTMITSPLLTPEQRAGVLRRIGDEPRLAQVPVVARGASEP